MQACKYKNMQRAKQRAKERVYIGYEFCILFWSNAFPKFKQLFKIFPLEIFIHAQFTPIHGRTFLEGTTRHTSLIFKYILFLDLI